MIKTLATQSPVQVIQSRGSIITFHTEVATEFIGESGSC